MSEWGFNSCFLFLSPLLSHFLPGGQMDAVNFLGSRGVMTREHVGGADSCVTYLELVFLLR
jgi:hypothetical protein